MGRLLGPRRTSQVRHSNRPSQSLQAESLSTKEIIHDERLALLELRRLLQPYPEIEIAGEARDGAAVLRMIDELSPDVLFLDIQMSGMTGLLCWSAAKKRHK